MWWRSTVAEASCTVWYHEDVERAITGLIYLKEAEVVLVTGLLYLLPERLGRDAHRPGEVPK